MTTSNSMSVKPRATDKDGDLPRTKMRRIFRIGVTTKSSMSVNPIRDSPPALAPLEVFVAVVKLSFSFPPPLTGLGAPQRGFVGGLSLMG